MASCKHGNYVTNKHGERDWVPTVKNYDRYRYQCTQCNGVFPYATRVTCTNTTQRGTA